MNEQIWTLNCRILGNFFLVKDETISSPTPFPSILKFVINPDFDENENQTGEFTISIEFAVDASNGKPTKRSVSYIGRDMLDYFLSLFTFLSVHPVRVLEPPVLTYHYHGTNRFRKIFLPSKQTTTSQPVALTNTSFLGIRLDKRVRRVLIWLRKGIEEENMVNSFISLCVALELLANQFKINETKYRICTKCGVKTEIEPSTRQRVEHVLVTELGYSVEVFMSIWEGRNRVLHGGFSKSAESEIELQGTRNNLLVALIRAVKKLLSIKNSDLPYEKLPDWPFTDPILEIEYTSPNQQ